MATRQDIYTALEQKTGFEVIGETETEGRLRFTGRCLSSRWNFFALVIFELNKLNNGSGINFEISKLYSNHADRLRYTWRVIIQGADLASKYQTVVDFIRRAPLPSRAEVDEVLLPGYRRGQIRGGVNAKGKGASAAGSAPMIVTGRGRV